MSPWRWAPLVGLLALAPPTARAAWVDMAGGVSGPVYATVVFRGELVAGGNFREASGQIVHHIARWDGTAWQPLGAGLGYADPTADDDQAWVSSLVVHQDGNLYVGGEFTSAGAVTAEHVARWDGSDWSALRQGVQGRVYCLLSHPWGLFVGGTFGLADRVIAAQNLAVWRNDGWRQVGEGVNAGVLALEPFGSGLVLGGLFSATGTGRTLHHVAQWDGQVLTSLGDEFTADPPNPAGIRDLKVVGATLYAAGVFSRVGTVRLSGVARWTGSAWASMQNPAGEPILALAQGSALGRYRGELLLGTESLSPNGLGSRHLVRHHTGVWRAFGGGMNDLVQTMVEFEGDLVVGGNFTQVNGAPIAHIVRWQEPSVPVWAPAVRVHDTAHGLEFEVSARAGAGLRVGASLELRREEQGVLALVDRRPLEGRASIVLVDPNPPQHETRYWIREVSEQATRALGPILAAGTARGGDFDLQRIANRGSTIRLRMRLSQGGPVEVIAVDLRGRRVRTLLRRMDSAATQILEWDGLDDRGRAVARGRYLVQARRGAERRSIGVTLGAR